MMIKTFRFRFFSIIALLFLSACSLSNEKAVREIDSLSKVQTELDNADQETLVVFDVDNTLTEPTDTALQFLWQPAAFSKEDTLFIGNLKKKLLDHLAQKGTRAAHEAQIKIWSQRLLKSAYVPVESITVSCIKKLQSRGVKVIALTACRAGARGDIDSLEKWRFNELKKVGIDLSGAFNIQEIIFDLLPLDEGYHPMFYRGILMATYTNPKGKVLAAFLDRISWKPKKILFFDDRKDYVDSVCNELQSRGISCQGYWYRAVMRQKHSLKRDIVQRQFDYLMQCEQVLSEDEAAAMLLKGT